MKSTRTSSLLWWCIAFGAMFAQSIAYNFPMATLKMPQDDKQLKGAYTNFIKQIREKVPIGKTCSDIKVLPKPELKKEKLQFVLAKIQTHKDLSATFALNITDLYLVAFEVGNTAYFFNDKDGKTSLVPMNSVFKDEAGKKPKNRELVGRADYEDLERSGVQRGTVTLGVRALFEAVKDLVQEVQAETRDLAKRRKALLVIIQMLSEAVRYKYIEKEVADATANGVKMTNDALYFEKHWASISEDVQCKRDPDLKRKQEILAFMLNIDTAIDCPNAMKDEKCK